MTSHHFEEKNCIIAGNPGKVIRRNIIWSRDEVDMDFERFDQCFDHNAIKYML